MEMGRVLKIENMKASILITVKENGFELIFGCSILNTKNV